MKIKAAVLNTIGLPRPYAESRPLAIEEVTLAPPGEGEVLVRIRAAGLCHSDLSVINGDRPRPVPMVLGHEAAGEVVALGRGVGDLAVGDHIVMVFVPSCGRCLACAEGRPALCAPAAAANAEGTLISGERRLARDGEPVNHHLGVSAFAEYAVCARPSLIRIDPDIPFEEAALFGCAVLTGVGAVINTARLPPGASTAVVGLGGVGLNAVLGAVLAGAELIVAVDPIAEKRALALSLGATAALDAGDPECVERIRALTGGGVDVAFEMAGSVKAMALAYAVTRRGGTTVSAGLSHPDHRFDLQHVGLVADERTIKGSYIGSAIPIRDLPRLLRLYRRGRLPVDRLLSDRLTLADINLGFDRFAEGKAVRQVAIP